MRLSKSAHSNPNPFHEDDIRPTQVKILGAGFSCTCTCPIQHWAVAFEFQDGPVLVAELTAINERGEVWNENRYSITNIRDLEAQGVYDLDEFLIHKNYRQLRHDGIWVTTSPHELHRRCSENTMTGEYYDLFFNNCQRWVVILLCGYGIDESKLPRRCGKCCQACLRWTAFGFWVSAPTQFVGALVDNWDGSEQMIWSGFLKFAGALLVVVSPVICVLFCAYRRCRNRRLQ